MIEHAKEIQEANPLALALDAEFEIMKQYQPESSGMEWLPEWFTKHQGNFESQRAAVKQQADKILTQIDRAEHYMHEKYESPLRQEIDRQFEAGKVGKKKSIDNLYGTIGYRKVASTSSIEITDEKAASDHCAYNIPEAIQTVTKLNKTVIKQHIKETGEEIPGVEIKQSQEYQKFYVKPTTALLERK